MKRIAYFLFALLCLASCHTPLQVTTVERNTPKVEKPNMEFLGFKNIKRNNIMLRDFGAELDKTNIAINRQDYYLGSFSLTELESYSSSQRYVTFVDVIRQSYSHNDALNDNYSMWQAGVYIASLTFGTLFPVYVPLLCAWDKNDCEISIAGEYTIVVYDTQEHKIILSVPFEVDVKDDYKGQYGHKKTDTRSVDTHYKNILYNSFVEQYLQVYNHLNAL